MEPGRWQEICDIYAEVLDLNAADRAAMLAERCREDEELRAEVESLLSMRSTHGILDSEIRGISRIAADRETLPPGTRLGPYEVVAPLGAGGMGIVYRAQDARVGRQVAIKMSSEQFSERFEREARVVASLNHPNICQLYDVGPDYLVMELVAGESPKGPLPLEEVLRICRQIAEAMEYAHERGVIHRDLKPANIKLTPDGVVKVLDFGLAKRMEQTAADPVIENSPTVTMTVTGAGILLGTAAYMAPEQANGKTVDQRADIWAFGAVFYELYTGRRPFRGEGVTEILASILKQEPDWNALPVETPAHIRDLLQWCLEKDRRQRLQSIGDARILLGRDPKAPVQRSKAWLAWAVAAVVGMAGLAGWLRTGRAVNDPREVVLTMVPPSGAPLAQVGGQASAPDISPDGSAVLYAARGGYYVRRLDSLESQRVPGSEAMTGSGFWSPDSTTVVYPAAGRGLIKVRMPDGIPQVLMPLSSPTRGGSWSAAGSVLIEAFPLSALPPAGGEAVKVRVPGLAAGEYKNPEFLPGSEDFLFLFVPDDKSQETEICLATFRDGKGVDLARLMKNPTAARYTDAGGGRILFVRENNLYSQKLNRSTRRLEGEPQLVVRGVASQPSSAVGRGDFSVSRNGVVAWRPGTAALNQVTIYDRSGKQIGTTGPPSSVAWLRLTPDGSRILGAGDRVWMLDEGRPGKQTLPGNVQWLDLSPDGSKVLGMRAKHLVEFSADGSADLRDLGLFDFRGGSQDISPDGKYILSTELGGSRGILLTPLRGREEERISRTFVQEDEGAVYPRFSPDGRWILYGSSSGLVVQPFPGRGRRQVVAPAAAFPVWRRDGEEIVYLVGQSVMAVSVDSVGIQLRFGSPKNLFSGLRMPSGLNVSGRPLDVSRDGSRFYFAQALDQPDSNMIHIKMPSLK